MRYRSTPVTLAPQLNRRCDHDHKNAVCRCIVHIRESPIDQQNPVIGRTVQMMVWRILAETHSLTTTVAMMISRISDTCVQASVVIAALSGRPMPPAPTRPSTVDSPMLMSQPNTEMPAEAGRTCGTMP